jgi:Fic family protein
MYDPLIPHNDLIRLPATFDYHNPDILSLALKANQALAKLDGLSLLLPNADVIMTPLMIRESVASNGIENINTTTVQYFQQEAMVQANLVGAEKEVAHYRATMIQ